MKKQILILTLVSLAIVLNSCEDDTFVNQSDSPSIIGFEQKEIQAKDGSENGCYYWFHGKRKYLKETTGKTFLLFDTESKDFRNSEICKGIENELQEVSFPGMVYIDYDKQDKKRLKWLVVNAERLKEIQQNQFRGVIYMSSFYLPQSEGREVGVSHLFYVKLKKSSDLVKLQELAKENNINIIGYNKYLPQWHTLSCNINSKGNAIQMANRFYETGIFEASEPDFMMDMLNYSAVSSSNDTFYNHQWNLHGQYSINWDNAYALSQGNNVSVAVFDTGIEPLHPDFNFGYGLMGFDTVDQGYDSGNIVYSEHGTACAGIIKATVGNGIGVAGIAPQATIYSVCNPLKTSPNLGQQLSLGLINASENCDVISCSWGGDIDHSMIEDALNYYCFMWGRNGKGCVVVFATGNEGGDIAFPANCDDRILAVGASDTSGRRKANSNYGLQLDVVAPGVNIPTTDLLGEYGYSIGNYFIGFGNTSAACPHVAGIAALVLSINPNLTRAEVNEIIQSTAQKVGGYNYLNTQGRPDGTWNIEMGYGLVDAYAAVLKAKQKKL